MILIDYRDKRPFYEQIVEKMQNLIVRGALEAESKLPSVRSMAMDLSVNPNTIQRAYTELEQLGYIYTIKGRGNYVSPESEWKEDKKQRIFEEARILVQHAKEVGILKEELKARIAGFYEEGMEDD